MSRSSNKALTCAALVVANVDHSVVSSHGCLSIAAPFAARREQTRVPAREPHAAAARVHDGARYPEPNRQLKRQVPGSAGNVHDAAALAQGIAAELAHQERREVNGAGVLPRFLSFLPRRCPRGLVDSWRRGPRRPTVVVVVVVSARRYPRSEARRVIAHPGGFPRVPDGLQSLLGEIDQLHHDVPRRARGGVRGWVGRVRRAG